MYLYPGYPGITHFVFLRSFFGTRIKLSDTIKSIIKEHQWRLFLTKHDNNRISSCWYGDTTCQDHEHGHLLKIQAEYYETDIGHANKNSRKCCRHLQKCSNHTNNDNMCTQRTCSSLTFCAGKCTYCGDISTGRICHCLVSQCYNFCSYRW
jgi:hypothetical protein